MGKELKKETESLIMHILMKWAHSEWFVEVWKNIDLKGQGRLEVWDSFCVRQITIPVLFSLAKRQQKAGMIEEYKIMNDMKKLNRE